MHVERRKPLPVIDHHQVALIEHGLSDDHDPVVRGQHRSSGRCVKIGSTMDAGELSVEHAPGSKRIGRRKRDRGSKSSLPQGLADLVSKCRILHYFIGRDEL